MNTKPQALADMWINEHPPWRVVVMPNGKTFIYPTSEKAQMGMVWAKAWGKYLELHPGSKKSYAEFARYLDIAKPLRRNEQGKVIRSVSNSAGAYIYGCIARGTMPKKYNPEAKDILYKLAGYPWQ